ncbi:MAG TPA: hypothetical protein VEL03_10805 [Streptosporangiaceae bacterium]|nr:hypothetical protein [Streptosporangiaceae bacterium]
MTPEVQYYAMAAADRASRSPSGLARRIYEPDGPVDETLGRDLRWRPDSGIVEWEYGDLGAELVKITERDAAHLLETFRARWGGPR